MDVKERLSKALTEAREKAGLNPLNVQTVSEKYLEELGKHFYLNNTTVRRYELGGQPSPAKLLTLARIYSVPLSSFFKAIGATDAEICGHSKKQVDRLERRAAEVMEFRHGRDRDPRHDDLHAKLQTILDADKEYAVSIIVSIEAIYDKMRSEDPPSKKSGTG